MYLPKPTAPWKMVGGSPDEVSNVKDCGLEVSEFGQQLYYYAYFHGKCENSFIPSAIGSIASFLFFFRYDLGTK